MIMQRTRHLRSWLFIGYDYAIEKPDTLCKVTTQGVLHRLATLAYSKIELEPKISYY